MAYDLDAPITLRAQEFFWTVIGQHLRRPEQHVLAVFGVVTGEFFAGAATVTGLGAVIGVPAMVVSTGLVVGGLANIGAGMKEWSGGGAGAASSGTKGSGETVNAARPEFNKV
jgi:hypothetical protein